MSRTPLLFPLTALLCACGSLLPQGAGPSTVQLAVNTDRLGRSVKGNALVREAGQTVARDFAFTAGTGVQQQTVYSGAVGTTVDLCVADATSGAKRAGLRFRLSRETHLVLLQEDAGGALSLQADVAGEPSPRASCSSLE